MHDRSKNALVWFLPMRAGLACIYDMRTTMADKSSHGLTFTWHDYKRLHGFRCFSMWKYRFGGDERWRQTLEKNGSVYFDRY